MKKSAVHAARLIAVVVALGFLTFYVLHAMGIVRFPSLRPRAQQGTSPSSKNGVIYEAAIDQWAIENNVGEVTFQFSNVSDITRASTELIRKGETPETDVTKPDFWSSYAPADQGASAKVSEAEATTPVPSETPSEKPVIMPSSKVGIMDFEKVFGPVKEEQPAEKEAPKAAGPPETFQGSKSGVPIFPVTPPVPDPVTVEIPAAKPESEPAPPPLQHTFGSSKALVPIIKPEPESEPAPKPEPETPQAPPAK